MKIWMASHDIVRLFFTLEKIPVQDVLGEVSVEAQLSAEAAIYL